MGAGGSGAGRRTTGTVAQISLAPGCPGQRRTHHGLGGSCIRPCLKPLRSVNSHLPFSIGQFALNFFHIDVFKVTDPCSSRRSAGNHRPCWVDPNLVARCWAGFSQAPLLLTMLWEHSLSVAWVDLEPRTLGLLLPGWWAYRLFGSPTHTVGDPGSRFLHPHLLPPEH